MLVHSYICFVVICLLLDIGHKLDKPLRDGELVLAYIECILAIYGITVLVLV